MKTENLSTSLGSLTHLLSNLSFNIWFLFNYKWHYSFHFNFQSFIASVQKCSCVVYTGLGPTSWETHSLASSFL